MELAIITPQELQSASTVLATTKSWVATYTKKEVILLAKAEKEGVKLTPETDQEINDFLASLKKANKKANDDRAPFTRKLDEVKGTFTAEENLLKALETKLQAKRDASVKAYTLEKAEQDRKDKLALDQAKARIELFAEAEAQIRTLYATHLSESKAELLNAFSTANIDLIEGVEEMLKSVIGTFEQSVWDGFEAKIDSVLMFPQSALIADELVEICKKAKEAKFEKVAPHYKTEIKAYADHLLTLIPDRRKELEEGKASKAAIDLKAEQDLATQKQTEQSQAKQIQQIASQIGSAVIDVQITQAHRSMSIPKAQSIESYTIEVTEQAGWSEIFKFYSTHCEKEMTEKTTLGSMKIFAEAEAKRNGTVITSSYLRYDAKYKAVVKSKKAA